MVGDRQSLSLCLICRGPYAHSEKGLESYSSHPPSVYRELIKAIQAVEQALDFFCLEGAVTLGPKGTGMFDTCDILEGKAKAAA